MKLFFNIVYVNSSKQCTLWKFALVTSRVKEHDRYACVMSWKFSSIHPGYLVLSILDYAGILFLYYRMNPCT